MGKGTKIFFIIVGIILLIFSAFVILQTLGGGLMFGTALLSYILAAFILFMGVGIIFVGLNE